MAAYDPLPTSSKQKATTAQKKPRQKKAPKERLEKAFDLLCKAKKMSQAPWLNQLDERLRCRIEADEDFGDGEDSQRRRDLYDLMVISKRGYFESTCRCYPKTNCKDEYHHLVKRLAHQINAEWKSWEECLRGYR